MHRLHLSVAKLGRAGRIVVFRLSEGEDLASGVKRAASEARIKAAVVSAIGSLKRAVLGFYDVERREYRKVEISRPLELISCSGVVSLVGEEVHVHLHAAVSDSSGLSMGGHVLEGCEVGFTVEGVLLEVEGVELRRARAESGLMVLDV